MMLRGSKSDRRHTLRGHAWRKISNGTFSRIVDGETAFHDTAVFRCPIGAREIYTAEAFSLWFIKLKR